MTSATSPRSRSGFTLIELLAAIGILLFGMLSAYAAVTLSIRNGVDSINRTIATHLATEGLELIRNIRDTNKINGYAWNQELSTGACATVNTTCTYLVDFNLTAPSGRLCLIGGGSCPTVIPLSFASSTGQYAYNGWASFVGTTSPFTRTISVMHVTDSGAGVAGFGPSTQYLRVTSVVSWSGGTKQVVLETHLYDWRP